jgi:type 2 lantibiotic biosynthesis protein LanM
MANGDFPDSILQHIGWDASTIFEKAIMVEKYVDSIQTQQNTAVSQSTLTREWSKNVDNLTKSAIVDRLKQRGVTKGTYLTIPEIEKLPDEAPAPSWLRTLDELITFTAEHCYSKTTTASDTEELPFEHIICTWVKYAVTLLNDECDYVGIPDPVPQGLTQWLHKELTTIANEALYTEFRTHIALNDMDQFTSHDTSSNKYYRTFIQKLHTYQGITKFLTTYPVLGRFLSTKINQWVDATTELDSRLSADRHKIIDEFGVCPDNSQLKSIRALPADSHNHGRVVMNIQFEDGTTIIYKPRSIRASEVFDDYLNHLSTITGVDLPQKNHLSCDGYGWVQAVENTSLETQYDIQEYYIRAGVLLAAAWGFNLSDAHYENIISTVDGPVIIDLETLFTPDISPSLGDKDTPELDEVVSGSVTSTGLLPETSNSASAPEQTLQNGFAIPKIPVDYGEARKEWTGINTDGMRIRVVDENIYVPDSPSNVPLLNSNHVTFSANVESVITGFQMAASHDRFFPQDDVKKWADGLETRVVLRQTRDYGKIIDGLTTPNVLKDGNQIKYTIDALLADELIDDPDLEEWDIFDAEVESLKRLDVPRFTVSADSNLVELNKESFCHLVSETGVNKALTDVKSIDDTIIQEQIDAIRLSAHPQRYGPQTKSDPDVDLLHNYHNIDWDRIAKRTLDTVFNASYKTDNSLSWIVRKAEYNNAPTIESINDGLYAGRVGIALAVALNSYVRNSKSTQSIVDVLIEPAIDTLRNTPESLHEQNGIGDGIGSLLYSVTVLHRIYPNGGYDDLSKKIIEQISKDYIDSIENSDVLTGRAGLLLALLTGYKISKNEQTLDKIIYTADSLLSDRIDSAAGHSVWDPDDEHQTPQVGFAHGTTGVAYALLRAYKSTELNRYRDSVEEALNFEYQYYNPETLSWSTAMVDGVSTSESWCYGRAGIVSARVDMERISPGITPENDLHRVIADIYPNVSDATDQICCGSAGSINALLTAATNTETPKYAQQAKTIFKSLLQKQHTRGHFEFNGHTPRLINPTLFQGLSGIAYISARIQEPAGIPNIQLFK